MARYIESVVLKVQALIAFVVEAISHKLTFSGFIIKFMLVVRSHQGKACTPKYFQSTVIG